MAKASVNTASHHVRFPPKVARELPARYAFGGQGAQLTGSLTATGETLDPFGKRILERSNLSNPRSIILDLRLDQGGNSSDRLTPVPRPGREIAQGETKGAAMPQLPRGYLTALQIRLAWVETARPSCNGSEGILSFIERSLVEPRPDRIRSSGARSRARANWTNRREEMPRRRR